MKQSKLLALVLLIVLLLCSCGTTQTTSETGSEALLSSTALPQTMRVLYSSKDSLNPYSCSTLQNRILSQLLFDPLYKLNANYEPVACLAEKAEVKGNTCTISLKSALFSDGTAVTAADVVFSFEKAKASATKYASALSSINKAVASGQSVTFTLTKNDPYCLNLLTFPILKSGSDSLKNNDNKSLPPIGCGRYIFNNETAVLTLNSNYYAQKPKVQQILTVDCPDDESILEAVESQMVDLYFTELSGSEIPKMNGVAKNVSQNHLVFLGVNPDGALQNVYLRQAVSALLDRTALCKEAYYSKAEPAVGLFLENWTPVQNRQTIQKQQNLQTAAQNMNLAGYTAKNSEGLYLNSKHSPLTLTLLVNKENTYRTAAAKLLVKQLKTGGITVALKELDYNQYKSAISAGHYDLYLSEVRIEDNMNPGSLSELKSGTLLTGGTLSSSNATTASGSSSQLSGTTSSGNENSSNSSTAISSAASTSSAEPVQEITLTTAAACNGFYNGTLQITDIVTAFTAELPVIPVLFKSGLAIYSTDFGALTPTVTDLFYGI